MSQNEKFMEFYLGTENPLVLDSMSHAKFQCFFDYSNYPFGDQKCFFYFLLIGSPLKERVEILFFSTIQSNPKFERQLRNEIKNIKNGFSSEKLLSEFYLSCLLETIRLPLF